VGGCAQAHDRFASVEIINEVFHFVVRKLAKAEKHHQHIGISQRLHPRDIHGVGRSDCPIAILRKKHGAIEAVPFCQDFRQHGQSFFGAILLVTTQENDVLANARAVRALIDNPIFGEDWTGRGQQQAGDHGC